MNLTPVMIETLDKAITSTLSGIAARAAYVTTSDDRNYLAILIDVLTELTELKESGESVDYGRIAG